MQVSLSSQQLFRDHATQIHPGAFEATSHFYPRVQNAQLHPQVGYFLSLTPERIAQRVRHLYPAIHGERLLTLLRTPTRHFRWGGTDLLHVTTGDGHRRMVVVETNSCPSGNKSMPLLHDGAEMGGYERLLTHAFLPALKRRGLPRGDLAVLFDKNHVEASGYAAALAELTQQPVWLAPLPRDGAAVKIKASQIHVRDASGQWHPIRACLRYVTQGPWAKLPVRTSTFVFNPIIACLAGGRNKSVAATAYELMNSQLSGSGLAIHMPRTVRDVRHEEIPLWLERFGGHAVVKIPYANAGQGVFTITSQAELDALMQRSFRYDRFIVQALIGHPNWSSHDEHGRYYHIGTMPNRKGDIFAADLRMMVANGPSGYQPIAIYGRRARLPLAPQLTGATSSWDMLGTNLSVAGENGAWGAETERLMLMDNRDFRMLGLGIDDLIDAYLQTVLSMQAIDTMAARLVNTKHELRRRLFRSLNDDAALFGELHP